jgi:Terpene cyclase DEP1
MSRRPSGRTPALAWVYLTLAVIGLASTAAFNVMAVKMFGMDYTPAAFVRVGFEGSPILGSLAADFWVGSLASVIWMVAEGKHLGMRRIGWYIVFTFVIAWAFALPLFLFARERHLARGGSTARYAAARLAGRANPSI